MCEEKVEQGVWELGPRPGNFMSSNSRHLAILKPAGAEKCFLKRRLDDQFLDAIRQRANHYFQLKNIPGGDPKYKNIQLAGA
jgi:hypothetical protein